MATGDGVPIGGTVREVSNNTVGLDWLTAAAANDNECSHDLMTGGSVNYSVISCMIGGHERPSERGWCASDWIFAAGCLVPEMSYGPKKGAKDTAVL